MSASPSCFHVANTIPRMKEEILANMAEWSAVFAKMGMEGEIERVADARLEDFSMTMTMGGLNVLTDRADELKVADDAWRLAHPDQALEERIE